MALARNTDKQTSHEAAEQLQETILWQIALAAVRTLQAKSNKGNATANEAAGYAAGVTGRNAESIRKRFAWLERTGRIKVVEERRCIVTGIKASAYRVTRIA